MREALRQRCDVGVRCETANDEARGAKRTQAHCGANDSRFVDCDRVQARIVGDAAAGVGTDLVLVDHPFEGAAVAEAVGEGGSGMPARVRKSL